MVKTWSTKYKKEDSILIPCNLCGSTKLSAAFSCKDFEYKKCSHCGLVQINPQPIKTSVQNRYGQDYLNYEIANEKIFLELALKSLHDAGIDQIKNTLCNLEQIDSLPKLSVLDVGCATGALLEHLRSRSWNVTGIEISKEQSEYARTKRGLNILELPLEENHFADNSFSLVIASHLIEHLNDPLSFVKEVFRILKKGGYFIVITPNIQSFQAKIFGAAWRSAIFDHLFLFSKKTLCGMLRKEDFTVENTLTWGGLAAGTAPPFIKNIFDRAAKHFGFGDVVLVRARK
ncbi:MAG: class I SAM-dependent methyltransferase [Termitinemataceae bacterium]|nr:MAG: class I SAM-dependent methyltransferase [Termitinemataceae bacterium]